MKLFIAYKNSFCVSVLLRSFVVLNLGGGMKDF